MSPAKVLTLIAILPLALALDITGIILVCFGLDDFFITDAIGLVIVGGWFYGLSFFTVGQSTTIEAPPAGARDELKKGIKEIKGQTAKIGEGTAKKAKWLKRIKWLRPLCILGELIPYLGCFFWWTMMVILELKYGPVSKT